MEQFPDHEGLRDAKTRAEVDILKELSSKYPNRVVKYLDFYANDEDQLVLVMERAQCTVLDLLMERRKLVEPDAKEVIFGMLDALHCVHVEDYVHRDLKPSNLLIMDRSDLSTIKIADFGTCVGNIGYSNLNQQAGTIFYTAPEMLAHNNYGKAVDLWSAGVTAYEILFGDVPFRATQKHVSAKNQLSTIKKGKLEFRGAIISESAKSFLKGLLEFDPAKRFTIDQALDHPWLNTVTGTAAPPPTLPPRAPPALPPRVDTGPIPVVDIPVAQDRQIKSAEHHNLPVRTESLEEGVGSIDSVEEVRLTHERKRSVRFDEVPTVIGVHVEEEEGPYLEPLPGHPGWFLVTQDDETVYFYNEITEESSWEPPDGAAAGTTDEGRGGGAGGLVGAFAPRSSSLPEPPSDEGKNDPDWGTPLSGFPDWRVVVAPDGSQYYCNVVTNETSWTSPDATGTTNPEVEPPALNRLSLSPLAKLRLVPPKQKNSDQPLPSSTESSLHQHKQPSATLATPPPSPNSVPAIRPKPTGFRAPKIQPPSSTAPSPNNHSIAQGWKSMLKKSVAQVAGKVLNSNSPSPAPVVVTHSTTPTPPVQVHVERPVSDGTTPIPPKRTNRAFSMPTAVAAALKAKNAADPEEGSAKGLEGDDGRGFITFPRTTIQQFDTTFRYDTLSDESPPPSPTPPSDDILPSKAPPSSATIADGESDTHEDPGLSAAIPLFKEVPTPCEDDQQFLPASYKQQKLFEIREQSSRFFLRRKPKTTQSQFGRLAESRPQSSVYYFSEPDHPPTVAAAKHAKFIQQFTPHMRYTAKPEGSITLRNLIAVQP
ncbi:hypothetical protein HK097_000076 [Rhizophlyctis rosea]|uniref:Uncharacterized protein n=1 Tax=Rhizophlyctis rosea TaxID=64517 RepID=A0AAD5SK31_9FUNG|nr:hypothetical protein HK097_000076 [Rhizophlyctis rosea]